MSKEDKSEVPQSAPPPHKLGIEINIQSEAVWKWWILKKPAKSLIESEPYRLNLQFKNLGDREFPGGEIQIVISWATRYKSYWTLKIQKMEPNDEKRAIAMRSDEIGSQGLALIYCYYVNSNDKAQVKLSSFDQSDEYEVGKSAEHAIGGMFCTTWSDIYTKYSMLTSAIGLALLALEKVAQFLKSLT